jgi:EH_Signature domain
MNEAARLEAKLLQINRDCFANWAEDTDALDGIGLRTAQILNRGNRASKTRAVDTERLELAVTTVRDNNSELTGRVLRYAAFGCCTRFTRSNYSLIGDAGALHRLLAAATAEIERDPRWFRRIFGGLLHSYFSAERQASWFSDDAIISGNERLRQFLEAHVDKTIALTPRTRWADALMARPALLSRRPGVDFSNEWIAGDTKSFETVAEQLGVGGGAWLSLTVARNALENITSMPDEAFRTHISVFLEIAGEPRFQALRDEIYAVLLTRYVECSTRAPHGALRDAVIAAWRAPWLTKNLAAWGRVSETTRKMVEGWLKLELIQQFFDVLSDDKQQDRRRFEFWRAYHEQMDAVYFVLGSDAGRRRDEDWTRLKTALEGRALSYVGSAKTHAFIMYIGDRAIVEFSQTGNAAYFYDKCNLDIGPERVSATTNWLKREPPGKRMLHADRPSMRWEVQFSGALNLPISPVTSNNTAGAPASQNSFANLFGQPATASAPRRDAAPERSPPTAFANLFGASSVSKPGPSTTRENDVVIPYARANGLTIDDRRSQGGSLWIMTGDGDALLNERLKHWGFRFNAGRGWWRAD